MDYPNGAHFQNQAHQNQNQQTYYSQSSQPAATTHAQPSPSPLNTAHHAPYPDPQGRFAQQTNQPPYNGPNPPYQMHQQQPMGSGGGGAMMPQSQAQPRAPQGYYPQTHAHSQSIPAPPVTAVQKFAQHNQAHSPQNHVSPYSSPSVPQSQSPSEPQPSPMAAPGQGNPPASMNLPTQPGQQQPPRSVPQSPLSAEAKTRENERMALLLEINGVLLQELLEVSNQAKTSSGVDATGNPKAPELSAKYAELLRRLNSNLSYMAVNAERYTSKPNATVPPGPGIMTAPTNMVPELQGKYEQLQTLFPNWKGAQQNVKQSPTVATQNRPPIAAS